MEINDKQENIVEESEALAHGKEEWLDKHGRPTYEYLRSLVEDGSPKALETLSGIAQDHEIDITIDADMNSVVDQIMLALNGDR